MAMRKLELGKSINPGVEAIKILLRHDPVDEDTIARVLAADESTLALLYFHLHFYLIRKPGEWIHDGSR
jgi:hypothetical protein